MNQIPIIGWAISFVANVSLAVPFYICWTACGIGETYFYFLPTVYHRIPFWSCVGIFIVLSVIRAFAPTFASVSQSNDDKK